jgi:hypothetical protein
LLLVTDEPKVRVALSLGVFSTNSLPGISELLELGIRKALKKVLVLPKKITKITPPERPLRYTELEHAGLARVSVKILEAEQIEVVQVWESESERVGVSWREGKRNGPGVWVCAWMGVNVCVCALTRERMHTCVYMHVDCIACVCACVHTCVQTLGKLDPYVVVSMLGSPTERNGLPKYGMPQIYSTKHVVAKDYRCEWNEYLEFIVTDAAKEVLEFQLMDKGVAGLTSDVPCGKVVLQVAELAQV